MSEHEQAWGQQPLSDVFRIGREQVFPSQQPKATFTHYSIPAWDEFGGPAVELGEAIESNKTAISGPSVLVSKLNPRKPRVAVIEAPEKRACCSTEFICYQPRRAGENLRFWGAYLYSPEFSARLARVAIGSTNSHTRASPRETLGWLVPSVPLAEQEVIAQILDTLDTAIRETEALIDKLKAVKQGLLHDLLTRGIDANGELRPPQSEAPQLYKESPLGWIPREWEVCPLFQQADVIDPQPDHRTPKEQEDGVPYVGIGDFDEHGRVCFSSCRRVVQGAFLKQRRRFEIEDGDIIYGKIGTIGKPKRLVAGNYALTANVLLLKPKSNPALFFMILSSAFERQILDITNTTSQPALGIETVRNLWVFKAPALENELISERLESLFSKISEETAMLHKLQQQKTGLMDDLLTGCVRVTPLLESVQQSAAQTGA